MKKIFALLLGTLSVCVAAAQGDITEPTLPPMEEHGLPQAFGPQAPKLLKMRGMEIDDGYGILNPYGAARLFGGTPSHDFYMDGLRYRRIGTYTLWTGISFSALGLLTMTGAIGLRSSSDNMERDYRNAVVGVGATMLGLGVSYGTVGVVFRGKAKRNFTRAVDIYNERSLSSSHDTCTPELSVGFTPGGVGLAYCF